MITLDPAVINHFANHPEIAPEIGGGKLDLSDGVRAPNVFLFGEHGGTAWMWHGPGVYEGHVMLTKAGRGKWGVEAGRAAIRYLADNGARILWARIHSAHVAVYARALGMEYTGQTIDLDVGGRMAPCRIFAWRAD